MANSTKPSQSFVPIKNIRNGVVILENGGLRSIIMVSSINFALKSPDEQAAIIMQFQNFLNSIDFQIQFYIQSRRLDIRPYLNILEQTKQAQENELLRLQAQEYMQFIKRFTETVNVMSKNFFVVIPYETILGSGSLPGFGKAKDEKAQSRIDQSLEESFTQLDQRVELVVNGLSRCGLRSIRLADEELTELYYRLYNPGDPGSMAKSE